MQSDWWAGPVFYFPYALDGNYLNDEYVHSQKKLKDYNQGISKSLETACTDIENISLQSDVVLKILFSCSNSNITHERKLGKGGGIIGPLLIKTCRLFIVSILCGRDLAWSFGGRH